jgi:hypothetical protein
LPDIAVRSPDIAVRSPDIAVSPPALQFTETGYFVHKSDPGCQAFDRVAE